MKRASLFLAAIGLPFLAGCSSIGYGDPNAVETVNIDYGSTDLQSLAAGMVESLINAPGLNYIQNPGKEGDDRFIVYLGDVENRTSEHIDTQGISDKIQFQLINSQKFRFVAADAGQTEIGDQVRFQQESGRVREEMQREFGRQLGADVILYGSLRSIDKKRGSSIESGGKRTEDVYYQFVLKCVNIDTAEIIWINEEELRKTEKTGIFGRT